MEASQISKYNCKPGTINEQLQGSEENTVFPIIFNVFIKKLEVQKQLLTELTKVPRSREE